MPPKSYQIRVCQSCGLRYPLPEGGPFGERCPVCLGSTEAIATHPLWTEKRIPFNHISRALKLSALLDNIRSAWNVGSIFRTADGLGLTHLHLCGITPTPETESLKKTALSAETSVTWTYHKNAVTAAMALKAEGCSLFALEEHVRAISIQQAKLKNEKCILIVGNEITGVDPGLLDLCDEIFFIPMHGQKKSFNVATAFGIAAFALLTGGGRATS